MDHNLDSLNLESAMGVDFESEVSVEVSQVDLGLSSSSHNEGIPMELEHIEEQPMLMDTGSEEIIDFMGDQFVLQEYSVQDDQTTGLTTTAESNQNVLTSQAESMVDLQLQPQTSIAPKIVAVKSVASRVSGKIATAAPPRQVAIAPKPPSLQWHAVGATGKQVAIAPKPVTLVKKVSLGNVMQNANNSMLAQIRKQIVMMPTGTQKLKLVNPTASTVTYVRTNTEQASLISTKEQPKPVMMAKVIMQGQSNVDINQPAVITKLLPSSSTKQNPTRVVAMQQKTVPITIGNKVVMASPTKQGVKLGKKQIIAIKSPTPTLLPGSPPALSPTTPKKVVLSANPTQNVILKTTAPPKTAQMGKDGSIVIDGQQHTQLHQINVPGKGIQYIRLVTNSGAGKAPGSLVSVPSKFLLTDNKVGGKKLVRIAPALPKTSTTVAQRSSQSLLAPLSPAPAPAPAPEMAELLQHARCIPKEELVVSEDSQGEVEMDSKAALRSLIESTVADDHHDHDHDHDHDHHDPHDQHDYQEHHDMQLSMAEVEIEYKRPKQASLRMQANRGADTTPGDLESRPEEHSLIVIPPPYDMNDDMIVPDDMQRSDESRRSLLNMDAEMMHSYESPQTPQTSEPDVPSSELGLRPRKACNCTKSQCLKLYCDCFANGEFCNRCNCNNCHNNLENEELRQKAIRGCLERNPNAFRPKIGKSKSGGPEIIRRHNKGCNCKRSGCLKNYCECYEAKIACTAMCKCVGCRNVEESLERFRRQELPARPARACPAAAFRGASDRQAKQPCSFMTSEVIEAVCQCLLAAAGEPERGAAREPLRDVIDEFARCLQDIIGAARHAAPPAPPAPPIGQGTT